MNKIHPKTKAVTHYNARIKLDCNGQPVEVIAFPKATFNPENYEPIRDKTNTCSFSDTKGQWLTEASNRARKRVKDIVYSNQELNTFVTLTLDKEKCNRYEYSEVIKKYNINLANLVRRKGLKYVLVPELHKDGAIHFHGFINNVLTMKKSGHKDKRSGSPIYNITDYKLGHSTAVVIDDNRQACANYILKYITKQQSCGKIGGRFYLHGGELCEPHCIYANIDYEALKLPDQTVSNALHYKVWTPERAHTHPTEYSEFTFSGLLNGESYAK